MTSTSPLGVFMGCSRELNRKTRAPPQQQQLTPWLEPAGVSSLGSCFPHAYSPWEAEGPFKNTTQPHHFLEGLTPVVAGCNANIGNLDTAHKALNDPAPAAATTHRQLPLPLPALPPPASPPPSGQTPFCQPRSPTLLAHWPFIRCVSA